MPLEIKGDYEIDYSGMWLPDVQAWAAHVAIYGPSPNPMHRNSIMPPQRVAVDRVFPSEADAEQEARTAALAMLDQHRS